MKSYTFEESYNQLVGSPSKEGVRRRLFHSPPKRKHTVSSFLSNSSGNTTVWRISKQTGVIVFFSFGIIFLVGVHVYLLHVMFNASSAQLDHQHQRSSEVEQALQPRADEKIPHVDHSQTHQNQVKIYENVNQRVEEELDNPTSALRGGNVSKQNKKKQLKPLRPMDYEKYTIRINTWRRPEQLLVSVAHHASCPGVAQVQVVWCDKEEEPPAELLNNYTNVVIERHDANSLNERFNIIEPTPTLGILSIDDDVLRPCESIDSGFFKWTKSPERMVGFDGRLHVENEDGTWQYGYLSTTEKANQYSLSLTRYCFIHRDYMDMYMNELPKTILETVEKNFNCEDIAMSFMISSMTDGKPSLLADLWAIKSMVKLYVQEKISGTSNHKKIRDECVDNFSFLLGLKEGRNRLQRAKYVHGKDSFFECGDSSSTSGKLEPKSNREEEFQQRLKRWHSQPKEDTQTDIRKLMSRAGFLAYNHGLLEKTDKWKARFGKPTS